jgi:hypothetical protein
MIRVKMKFLHSLHSSVFVLPNGACGECRRGSLYFLDIPMPIVWNSIQDWMQAAPFVRHYFSEFPQPSHWNYDQYAISQWFHESNLWYDEESNEWSTGGATVFLKDKNTGYMIPVFMNLETGIMQIKGQIVYSFSEAGIEVSEIWRMEMGDLYRVM